jgi:hypothetical protein
MRTIAKTTLGALLLAGTAVAFAAPASAGVSFGIGFGPSYYGPPPAAYYYCDPRSRYYDPYYCDDYDYYYGSPLWIDGYWYNGPIRSRWYSGHRQFWVRNGWHSSDRYRGGGEFRRGGSWGGGSHGGSWGGGSHGGSWGGGSHGGSWGGGHGGGGHGGGGGGHGGGGHGGHH